MKPSSTRRALVTLTTVGVVLVLALAGLVGPAAAAQPKTGHYSHAYDNPETPYDPDTTVSFDVVTANGKLKVKQLQWSNFTCSILTVDKALAVSSKGKFKFLGEASTPGTVKIKIKVKGKFTSPSKAKVTLKGKDDEYPCGTHKATVKREG